MEIFSTKIYNLQEFEGIKIEYVEQYLSKLDSSASAKRKHYRALISAIAIDKEESVEIKFNVLNSQGIVVNSGRGIIWINPGERKIMEFDIWGDIRKNPKGGEKIILTLLIVSKTKNGSRGYFSMPLNRLIGTTGSSNGPLILKWSIFFILFLVVIKKCWPGCSDPY